MRSTDLKWHDDVLGGLEISVDPIIVDVGFY